MASRAQREEVGSSIPILLLFQKAMGLVDLVIGKLIVALMAAMVVIVFSQVFYRYVLNDSIDWAEETSRLCFVSITFLAIPLGIKRGAHIGLSLVVDRIPLRYRDILFRILSVVVAAMMVLIAWEAAKMVMITWDEKIPSIGVSTGSFYIGLVVGAAHSALRLLEVAADGSPVASTREATE